MSDIPNTEYITIKSDGIFVGGKPTTTYRWIKIGSAEYIKTAFKSIQTQYPNIKEIRFLTSKTSGECYKTGTPVIENGSNLWACVMFNDGYVGPWVAVAKDIYDIIVFHISHELRLMAENPYAFLNPLLGRYQDVVVRMNLQSMAGKSYELNGYRITIEKINQKQR